MKLDIDVAALDAIVTGCASNNAPGVAVGVSVDGQPMYRRAVGSAHFELDTPLAPTLRMRIGSISKQFTALAFLMLCEAGRADIDDPIERWLPEIGSASHGATVRQLLGHTSGLRDAYDLACLFCGLDAELSADDLLGFYRCFDDTNHARGCGWSYNNGGYLLASVAIERIAGCPLDRLLKTCVFEPAGMASTMLRHRDRDCVSNSATLHLARSDGGFDKGFNGALCSGAGAVVSTINDMLRWLALIDAPHIGSPATWEVMKSPATLKNGVATGYGLGFVIQDYRGLPTLSHSGGVIGGNAQFVKVLSAGLDVVVISNRSDLASASLANQIVDACMPGLPPIDERHCPAPIEGLFQSPSSGRLLELRAKGDSQTVVIDGAEQPLVRDPGRSLRPPSHRAYVKLTITPDDQEESGGLWLDEFGTRERFEALAPLQDRAADRIAGRYHCCSLDIELTIEPDRMRTTSPHGGSQFALRPVAEHVWRAQAEGLVPMTAIIRDTGSCVTLATGRNRSLHFQRVGAA